jgi:hypothetical protein
MEKRSPILIPAYDFDVLDYFGESFEAVYGILHPFEKVAPENRDIIDETWAPDDNNPYIGTHLEFAARGNGPDWIHYQTLIHPFSWRDIVEMLGFPSLNYLNQLLLECCSARRRDHGEDIDRMFEIMGPLGIDRPTEGQFSPLLLDNILRSFQDMGNSTVQLTSAFGDKTAVFDVEHLLSKKLTTLDSALRGGSLVTLHSENYQLLYGVHWDSFFTFLCGRKDDVSAIVEKYPFEGFFFQSGMTLGWENDEIIIV